MGKGTFSTHSSKNPSAYLAWHEEPGAVSFGVSVSNGMRSKALSLKSSTVSRDLVHDDQMGAG